MSRPLRLLAASASIAALLPAAASSQLPMVTRQIDVALTEGTSMAAAVSPDRRWIAIDLLGALWLLPFRGGEATRLTPEALEARQPTWSPDNRSIAFEGYDDGAWHIYVTTRDGGDAKPITTGPFDDREPAWSHDGSRIAFASDRYGGISTIWEVSPSGGGPRQVSARDGYMPAWTARDAELTFVSRDDAHAAAATEAGIWAVDGDGHERQLTNAADGLPSALGWNPSSGDLAYTMAGRLYLNGRADRNDEDVFPFRPQWITRSDLIYTADGQIKHRSLNGQTSTIPFSAKVSLQRASYTIEHRALDVREPQPLRGIVAPVVSPDGRAIAFIAMGDVWVMPIGGTPMQVTNDDAVELDPAWSPDGNALAFSSDRGGRMDLWVHDFRTNDERQLTNEGGVSGAAWSPDGNHIAYAVHRRDVSIVEVHHDTHRFNMARGNPSPTEIGRPTWSADNTVLAYGALFPYSRRFREGLNQLLIAALESGGRFSSLLLPEHSAGNREHDGPVWAPDGFRMAFVSEGTLMTVPVDGRGGATGPPRAIVGGHPSSPSWEGDSDHLVYQTPSGLRRVLSTGGIGVEVPLNLQWRAAPAARIVIHAGRVWDGTGDALRTESDIVVENGVITEITGHHDDLHVGAVVDASDETVIPGLIDMHAHYDTDYGSRFGRIWLAYGITSVRIPAIDPYAGIEMQEAFDAGRRPGPRVFIAGDPFDGVRVYYPGGVSVASDEQLTDQLERARDLGVDFFKTYVRLPDRFQKSVIEYAHSLGRSVTSHELYPAAAFGADGVEHLRGTSRRGYSPKASATHHAYRDVIDLIVKSGMTLTPTIGIEGAFAARESGDKDLLYDKRLALFPSPVIASLAELAAARAVPSPSVALDPILKPYEATIKAIVAGGGRIIAGTDSPIVPYGLGLHAELDAYVHAGLTPLQALQTATVNAAQALGLAAEIGTIEVDKRADLTFLDGDPLDDIRNARRVRRVMRSGRLYNIDDLLPPR